MTKKLTNINGKKILIVAEAYIREGSPALVTKQLIKILQNEGAKIGIYSTDFVNDSITNLDTHYFSRPFETIKSLSHLVKMKDAEIFSDVINKFNPDIVHFVPISYNNSGFLIKIAKSAGIRVVGQVWGPNFYCSSNYSVLDDQICTLCSKGSFLNAVKNNCTPIKSQVLKQISLLSLRKSLKSVDVFLSTSKFIDDRLIEYGIISKRIIRLPLTFPKDRINIPTQSISNHIIFYGQPIRVKGVHLLYDICSKLPKQNFEIYLSGSNSTLSKGINLKELSNLANVKVIYNETWKTVVANRLSSSAAVLIPSIWPTTTEMVLMESLGMGKPIIAFNVGVHAEILQNNESALIFNPNDIVGFTQGIKKLIEQPKLRKKLSEGAVRLFNILTDSENIKETLDRVYNYK